MVTQNRKCKHCGRRFEINTRGRPQLYCKPSHRVRAREKRRELETRQPSEKVFRLLKQRLEALRRWRVRRNRIVGIEELRQFMGLPRGAAYQKAVERVLVCLVQLAPELIQDLAEPWRGTLSAIEAMQVIQRQESSTVRTRP